MSDASAGLRADFLAWCDKERTQARESLEMFEKGTLQVFQGTPGDGVDVSDSHMAHLRDVIAKMTAIIDHGGWPAPGETKAS